MRLGMGAGLGLIAAVSGACGSSSAVVSASPSTTLPLGSATTSAPNATTSLSPTSVGSVPTTFPSVSQLEGISDYSYSEVTGNGQNSIAISGRVASATNFEFKSTVLSSYTVVANGKTYITLTNKVYSSPATSADVPPLVGFAEQVGNLAHNSSGMVLKHVGKCSFAGQAGDAWTISSANAPVNFGQIYRVCTSSSSGYLLSVIAEVQIGSGVPTVNEEFQVDSVGNVPPILVPTAG